MSQRRPFDRPSDARRELDRLILGNLGFRLGPYLKKLAQASVAAAMLAACNTSHTVPPGSDAGADAGPPDMVDAGPPGFDAGPPDVDAGPPPPPPSSDLCSPEGQYLAVHGIDPTSSSAWTGALNHNDFRGPFAEFIDEVGTRCDDATDQASCLAEIESIQEMTYQRAIVTTAGDTVTSRASDEDFLAFLGPINTPNEAALVAWKQGYEIFCSDDLPSSVTEVSDGFRVIAYQQSGGCGSPWVTTRFTLHVDTAATVTVEEEVVVRTEEDWGCVGRRPAGLRAATPSRASSPVGAFFANVTRLEASAVDAFDIMAGELERLGAPDAMIAAARAAQADEVRHTDQMAAIARRYGAEPGTGRIDPVGERTEFEIALENAVEGCVRETFGALVGAYQANAAQDPDIAAAMRSVADDELRHAELSWALASWLEPRLTDEERARIAEARAEAIVALRQEAAMKHDRSLIEVAGLPTPEAAVAMVDQLASDVWA